MELRVLRYFVTIAREESITGAARALHVSQPALSRQMRDLEEELGKTLFHRGKKISLTQEGRLMRQRAEEILTLVNKMEGELSDEAGEVSGDIYIVAGESEVVHFLTDAGARLHQQHPNIRIHLSSGDSLNVYSGLDRGLADFGLMFEQPDEHSFDCLPLPEQDHHGVLMRRDDPLAEREYVTIDDLMGKDVIVQRGMLVLSDLTGWESEYRRKVNISSSEALNHHLKGNESWERFLAGIHIVGSYSLLYNASLMVRSGMGYALAFDRIVIPSEENGLCLKPLRPEWRFTPYLVWKRYQVLSRAAELFLRTLREEIGAE